ncbi:MAG: gliding motility-associated C-terminal domain-containing protein [Bacteroidota bacterium]
MTRFTITFLLFFVGAALYAQPCNFPFSASNTCQDAPLVCTLDNYCSSNQGSTNTGTPNAFCGQVENNSWVSFIAGSTTFELAITVDNCNQNNGLQAQFLGTDDCNNFFSVSNCLDPVFGTANLTASNLEIGTVYYLMMDGKGGDVCDYQYELISGEILSPADVFVDPVNFLCPNQNLTINSVAVSPNSSLTYQWSTTDGNIVSDPQSPIIEVNAPGTYEVFAEDDQGCSATTTIEVVLAPDHLVTIGTPDILNCVDNVTENLSVTVDPPNSQTYDYEWTTTDGNILNGANTASPEVDAPGRYYVTVTNNFGCEKIDSVQVFADVNTPVANAGLDGELNCLVTILDLGGELSSLGNDFSYQWLTPDGNIITGSNTLFPTVDAPGTYQIIVTNNINGCTATDEAIVFLNDETPTDAILDVKQPCFGEINGSIKIDSVIGGIPPYQYAFDGTSFSFNDEKDFLEPADYEIVIQDATGCEWATMITIAPQPELVINLGDDQLIALGCEVDIQAQINFPENQIETLTWSPSLDCGFPCLDTTIIPLDPITYTVDVVDVNGCRARDTVSYLVKKDRNIYIPNVFTPNDDGMNDRFVVYGGKDVAEILSFRVFDRWGAVVLEHKNFMPNQDEFGWDGYLNDQRMNENVFVYLVEVLFVDGWVERYTGDVTLLR